MSEENKDFEPTEITDEKRIELIKRAISSDAGWQALAKSVRYHSTANYEDVKAVCVSLLRQIAGDREVDVPTANGATVKVKFADMLVQQLEYNIALVEATKKDE
jgi:hypothetical protein